MSVMSKLVAVAALIVGVVLALFGAQNQDRVAPHSLWFSSRPLPASLGVLVGVLAMLPGRLASGHTARGLRREVADRDARAIRVSASMPTTAAARTVESEEALPQEARR